jgi:putative endonuclease
VSRARQELARAGEEAAAAFLQARGIQILERNYRCRAGEIDLVGRQGDTLIFVEVKTRRGLAFGLPAEAVHPRKQRKLRQVALCYLTHRRLGEPPCRFDVVSVLGSPGSFRIDHIPHAF